MRNWLKGRVLLAILISICMLVVILTPGEAKATVSMTNRVSISAGFHDSALLSVPYTVGDRLWAPKPNRNDAFANRTSVKHLVTSFSIHGYSIPNLHAFLNCTGSFNSVFRRAFQQACLLLDLPPPSHTIS